MIVRVTMNSIKLRKKKKSSFNIVDIIIVALLALFLAYFIYSAILGGNLYNIGAKKGTVEYTVCIEHVRTDYSNNFDIGDAVKNTDGTLSLGTIIGKSSELSDDGLTYSILLTIRTQAYMRKNSVFNVDKQKIKQDSTISLRFPDYAPYSAVIADIKVV